MDSENNGSAENPVFGDSLDTSSIATLLLGEVNRLIGDKLREKTKDDPITQKSGRDIMFELSKKDGRTQLELVNATHLKAPTVSVVLKKLEEEGYVMRNPDSYDKRATRVHLTEKGRELDGKIKEIVCTEGRHILSGLTAGECEQLVKLLTKIKTGLLSDDKNTSEQ